VPPFPVEEAVTYSELWPAILVELLERRRTVAVCLLRLGGFSAGVFRGEALVDSKTAQRFVKNRHRKGGQSQRRFDRIREKQVHELFGMACEESREKLTQYEDEIEHVFFGGDRHTLQAFRKECSYFERFGDRVRRRVLAVPGDPRRALLEAMPREVWSSEVWRVELGVDGGR
jgi:peptide subunit release factor 1 (eRF1)